LTHRVFHACVVFNFICLFNIDQTIDILVSEYDEIRRLRRNPLDNSSHYGSLVDNQHDVSFMSIDTNNRMFYWIDESNYEIYRAHLTPSSISLTYPQELLFDYDEHEIHPSSVSIDWISQNLYVTDNTHGCIWVMKNDGRYATKVITDIESPWVIAVNPILGIMYFINYEHDFDDGQSDERIVAIESASMNGDNRVVLVDTDIIYPTDLVIDFYQTHRIYWTDEKKESIESMNYDGTDRMTIAHIGIHAPHSLDIFANHVFWIDRNNRSLSSIDKFGRGVSTRVLDRLESPLFVRLYHPWKQIQSGL
jgi:low density lipoprotein-related protein 2